MRLTRIVLTLALLTASIVAAGELPTVGSKAPEFTLMTDAGKEAALADFRGDWVVLYFYPKDFTSGCTLQARNFQQDLDKYKERDAVILGVSVDTPDSHKGFCEKEGLKFTLLSDTDGQVSAAYGSVMEYEGKSYSARNTFLIDPEGTIVRVFEKAKPSSNSEEVLAALDELRAR